MDCQRHLFNLNPDITYLNCAYMGPTPKASNDAGMVGLVQKMNPYLIRKSDFFEPLQRVKELFANLINCDNAQRIAFIPSVSYGMANLAFNTNLKRGENIVIMEEQFPSNYYIWERVCKENDATLRTANFDSFRTKADQLNDSILSLIDEKTNAICLAHVHWADGTLIDLDAIIAKAKSKGAKVIVDGSQSVGALPFSLDLYDVDALVCAGYKWLLGPYGSGLSYIGPAFDDGKPIEENWINRKESERFENLVQYQSEYKPFAGRYNMGEQSNFISLPTLESNLILLNTIGTDKIQAYCERIQYEAIQELREIGFYIPEDSKRSFHLFGLELPNHLQAKDVLKILKEEQIYISIRGPVLRISPNIYNDNSDMNILAGCLKSLL